MQIISVSYAKMYALPVNSTLVQIRTEQNFKRRCFLKNILSLINRFH